MGINHKGLNTSSPWVTRAPYKLCVHALLCMHGTKRVTCTNKGRGKRLAPSAYSYIGRPARISESLVPRLVLVWGRYVPAAIYGKTSPAPGPGPNSGHAHMHQAPTWLPPSRALSCAWRLQTTSSISPSTSITW